MVAAPQEPGPLLARDVPVTLDVRRLGVIGLSGDPDLAQARACWLVVQAAVLHSPRDLSLVLLTDDDQLQPVAGTGSAACPTPAPTTCPTSDPPDPPDPPVVTVTPEVTVVTVPAPGRRSRWWATTRSRLRAGWRS
jgi:hypothetical protein